MISLLLRPHRTLHVISFFIEKDDRSVGGWSAAAWSENWWIFIFVGLKGIFLLFPATVNVKDESNVSMDNNYASKI